jgi:hypothetical protein
VYSSRRSSSLSHTVYRIVAVGEVQTGPFCGAAMKRTTVDAIASGGVSHGERVMN